MNRMTLPLRPGTAHELLDLAEKDGLEFLLRVMLFDLHAGLLLDLLPQIGIVDELPQGPIPGLGIVGDQEARLAMPHAIGVDLDVGIDARDAASTILAELGVRLRTMKDVVGQGGQADLEPGGREAAEKTVVVVDHGVMPHRGQFGRRSRSPEVRLDPRSLFVHQPPQGRKEDPPQRIVQPAGRVDQLHGSAGRLRGPPHLAKIDRAGNHFHAGIQQSGACQQRPRIDSHQACRRKVLGQHGQLLGLGKGPAAAESGESSKKLSSRS